MWSGALQPLLFYLPASCSTPSAPSSSLTMNDGIWGEEEEEGEQAAAMNIFIGLQEWKCSRAIQCCSFVQFL